MTTTIENDIGGWASVIINQNNEAQIAENRAAGLFERLGRGFYMANNPSYSPEKKAAHVEACVRLVDEIRRVLDIDSKHKALWEFAYLSEAEKCGVDHDLVDEQVVFAAARNKMRVDPVFAAKIEEYAITEGAKK